MYGDPSEPAPELRGLAVEMPHYTREWHFDAYHQALGFARQHAADQSESDTEWIAWEVFQQTRRGEHHTHVGSLHAPDAEIALLLAKENFARRGACVNLWVVPAHRIHATDYADEDVFVHTTDRMYREPGGFHGLRKAIHRDKESGEQEDDHVEAVLGTGAAVAESGRGGVR